jgi:hypothetical protein
MSVMTFVPCPLFAPRPHGIPFHEAVAGSRLRNLPRVQPNISDKNPIGLCQDDLGE